MSSWESIELSREGELDPRRRIRAGAIVGIEANGKLRRVGVVIEDGMRKRGESNRFATIRVFSDWTYFDGTWIVRVPQDDEHMRIVFICDSEGRGP